jgi:hypothetical protein
MAETDTSEPRRLGDFLRDHREEILAAWERAVGTIGGALAPRRRWFPARAGGRGISPPGPVGERVPPGAFSARVEREGTIFLRDASADPAISASPTCAPGTHTLYGAPLTAADEIRDLIDYTRARQGSALPRSRREADLAEICRQAIETSGCCIRAATCGSR